MFQIDARKEKLTLVEVFGRPALFTTERVNRATVPEGLHAYDMQTSEDDWGQPCLMGKHITVEHFGTVLTASPIDLPDTGYLDLKPGDFAMGTGSDRLTVAGFEDRYLGRHLPIRPVRAHKPKPHRASVPVR